MLEKTKHTWFPTQKNTSKTYVTDSRNVLLSCARGKVSRFYHSHKNLSLSLSLSHCLWISRSLISSFSYKQTCIFSFLFQPINKILILEDLTFAGLLAVKGLLFFKDAVNGSLLFWYDKKAQNCSKMEKCLRCKISDREKKHYVAGPFHYQQQKNSQNT